MCAFLSGERTLHKWPQRSTRDHLKRLRGQWTCSSHVEDVIAMQMGALNSTVGRASDAIHHPVSVTRP